MATTTKRLRWKPTARDWADLALACVHEAATAAHASENTADPRLAHVRKARVGHFDALANKCEVAARCAIDARRSEKRPTEGAGGGDND